MTTRDRLQSQAAIWLVERADQVSLRMSGLLARSGVWSTQVANAVALDEWRSLTRKSIKSKPKRTSRSRRRR